jgi:hypothetical protein
MITFAKMQIPFAQYPLIVVMIKEMALRKHMFVCAKHGP